MVYSLDKVICVINFIIVFEYMWLFFVWNKIVETV